MNAGAVPAAAGRWQSSRGYLDGRVKKWVGGSGMPLRALSSVAFEPAIVLTDGGFY